MLDVFSENETFSGVSCCKCAKEGFLALKIYMEMVKP
jgi:hypothetical protein